jgi:2-succinyl-5-enolpyruvyl-6-hydroxy-3-cyclohexene-1-carboxylate synthase
MSPTTDTYALLRAFVDELAHCGMRAACTSPGSRSAPLVLSLAREPRVRCFSHVDERCAGFFALGLAKASGLPVAVACTSGTAAAELLAAAIEAREARVPLLLLTADRPAELRENGAGQAIDQLKLFGGAAKWFFEVGVHEAGVERLRWMRTLACRAYWTALEGSPGAVHLNFPLREPLVSEDRLPGDATGREHGRPYVRRSSVRAQGAGATNTGEPGAALRELATGAHRGVVVAGREERRTGLGVAAAAFAAAAGWPLLADPLSRARRGAAAIAHYDALLRDDAFAASLAPDLVLRVGDLPVSKPLRTWLAGLDGVRQVALDPEGAWQDPASVLAESLALDPVDALAELARAHALAAGTSTEPTGALTEPAKTPTAPSASRTVAAEDWLAGWRSADARAAEAILGALGDGELSEPTVATELGVLLPEQATLFVASSMPVRDIETFWPVRADPPRVLCNRGANGIDGTVSSAFGAAAHSADQASDAGPVVLLIGDVALAHDIGGLLAATRLGLKLTIVLLDNDGGGIFDFLPVSGASIARTPAAHAGGPGATDGPGSTDGDEDIYTRHIATPTGLDFAKAAALYGLAHEPVQTIPAFRATLERALSPQAGSMIVHVRTDRARNVALHRRVWSAVSRVGAQR